MSDPIMPPYFFIRRLTDASVSGAWEYGCQWWTATAPTERAAREAHRIMMTAYEVGRNHARAEIGRYLSGLIWDAEKSL